MSRFFNAFAFLCATLMAVTVLSGQFHALIPLTQAQHMLLGLSTGILVVMLHCLIFAIFTGSGKDTRLLSEDLKLSAEYLKEAKGF